MVLRLAIQSKLVLTWSATGAVAAYGKAAEQNGRLLAVDEINKAGGVDGKSLSLSQDNKSENAEASTSSTNLAIQNNVLRWSSLSGAVAALAFVSQKQGVPCWHLQVRD